MKISVITPTHNPKHLPELEESLIDQTYQDWEWIILTNNKATYTPKHDDSRIKMFYHKGKTSSVGYLKKKACKYATGEIIAEVDHDDFLIDNCLEEIAKAYKEDPEVGFVYSRTIYLKEDGEFIPYSPKHGWTYDKIRWRDKELITMREQPLYPGNIGYIWWTPNHIRTWKKDVYDEVGGHNENLPICDDQDLICKLYLKTKFKCVHKPLYFYRITGENTWLKYNKDIQDTTHKLYDKYIESLILRYCELNNLVIINSLSNLQNLKNKSVGLIKSIDDLHNHPDKFAIIEQIHRVLAPGGMFICEVPSTDGRGPFMIPTTQSYWNELSFWYFIEEREQKNYLPEQYKHLVFRERKLETYFPSEWHKDNNIPFVRIHLMKF